MLGKLFGRKKSLDKPSPKLRDIYMTLFKLKRNHSFVHVQFAGDSKQYQTMILEVDPDKKKLTIDELFPKKDGFIAMEGQTVYFVIRDQGLKISFETEVLKRGESDGAPYYEVRLPNKIAKDQRRGAFRVDVMKEVDVMVSIDQEEYSHLLAKVANISYSGVRLEIEGNQSELLKPGLIVHDCKIRLADFGELTCSIDLRNLLVNEEPYHHTHVGARFVSVNGDARRVLEKFLIHQQRKNLRESSEEAA